MAGILKLQAEQVSRTKVTMLAVDVHVDESTGEIYTRPRTRPHPTPLTHDSARATATLKAWPCSMLKATARLCSRTADRDAALATLKKHWGVHGLFPIVRHRPEPCDQRDKRNIAWLVPPYHPTLEGRGRIPSQVRQYCQDPWNIALLQHAWAEPAGMVTPKADTIPKVMVSWKNARPTLYKYLKPSNTRIPVADDLIKEEKGEGRMEQ